MPRSLPRRKRDTGWQTWVDWRPSGASHRRTPGPGDGRSGAAPCGSIRPSFPTVPAQGRISTARSQPWVGTAATGEQIGRARDNPAGTGHRGRLLSRWNAGLGGVMTSRRGGSDRVFSGAQVTPNDLDHLHDPGSGVSVQGVSDHLHDPGSGVSGVGSIRHPQRWVVTVRWMGSEVVPGSGFYLRKSSLGRDFISSAAGCYCPLDGLRNRPWVGISRGWGYPSSSAAGCYCPLDGLRNRPWVGISRVGILSGISLGFQISDGRLGRLSPVAVMCLLAAYALVCPPGPTRAASSG
jgi:hypothetical protein